MSWSDARAAVAADAFELTDHARRRMNERGITGADQKSAVASGTVVTTRRDRGVRVYEVRGTRVLGGTIFVVLEDLGTPLFVTVFFHVDPSEE